MTIDRRTTGVIGFLLAAAVLLSGSIGGITGDRQTHLVDDVEVEVTDLSVNDGTTGEIELTWNIKTEDDALADHRHGYCIRGRLDSTYAWTLASCRNGADTTSATVALGKPTHCRPYGVDYASQGQIAINYYGDIGWPYASSWSDIYTKTVTYYCDLSSPGEIHRDR